jgi:hypothetical protein
MADRDNNLLCDLHRWAYRQDENFVSEAFAHLLRRLLAEALEAGVAIINSLTRNNLALTAELAHATEIRTQVSGDIGFQSFKMPQSAWVTAQSKKPSGLNGAINGLTTCPSLRKRFTSSHAQRSVSWFAWRSLSNSVLIV